MTEATADDWGMEYLDYIMSVKIVDSIDEAIEHINRYNTSHSEAIITNDYDNAQKSVSYTHLLLWYIDRSIPLLRCQCRGGFLCYHLKQLPCSYY